MFNKFQIAAAGLALTAALSGCGSDADEADASPTPSSSVDTTAPSAPETSASSEAPAAAPVLGSLELAPGTDLKDGQKVKVTIGGYGQLTGAASVVLCAPAVVSDTTHPEKYCDMRPASMGLVEIKDGAGAGSFTMAVGASFQAELSTSTCDPGGKCLVLATSTTQDPQYASIAEATFAP